jgi:hypothetical protein
MASLKAFLPTLSKIVDVTADALYSRQRALAQLGLVKTVKGRGPGSGVLLSGESLAALIIALMVADTLIETDERVRRACQASPKDGAECPWTGARTLQQALSVLLLSEERVKSFAVFSIHRELRAQLNYGRPDELFGSVFGMKGSRSRRPITITARIESRTMEQLSKALRSELGGEAT